MNRINPAPHPTASITSAVQPEGRLAGEHIDAHLVARLTPGGDLDFVLGSVPVPGPAGPQGPPGDDGTNWFDGEGAPIEPIIGAAEGDYYLDTLTGDIWTLGSVPPFLVVRQITPGG
jgi:hypothetical protein